MVLIMNDVRNYQINGKTVSGSAWVEIASSCRWRQWKGVSAQFAKLHVHPSHNSSSNLMACVVLPPFCPACESNLMAINGAPLSSRYHPLQYNALYAQRKMWPTGCEWCPSWEHQHVIWICQTLLISFKTESHKTFVQIWNVKSKNCNVATKTMVVNPKWSARPWWVICAWWPVGLPTGWTRAH